MIDGTNILLMIAYSAVAYLLKRPSYLLAFLLSCALLDLSLFDALEEYQLYLMTFIIYSYLVCNAVTDKEKNACVIVSSICLQFSCDAFFYGVDGYYGARKTFIWDNIESIALFAHILIISTLIDYGRIWNNICSIVSSIVYSTSSAYNMSYVAQTISKGYSK